MLYFIKPSIGVDFFSKTLRFRNKSLKLQVWDSAGQEKYRSLIPNYIRGSSIIFIIFDVTNKHTFDSVSSWLKFIKNIENPIIILCGNKIDLNEERYIFFHIDRCLLRRPLLLRNKKI